MIIQLILVNAIVLLGSVTELVQSMNISRQRRYNDVVDIADSMFAKENMLDEKMLKVLRASNNHDLFGNNDEDKTTRNPTKPIGLMYNGNSTNIQIHSANAPTLTNRNCSTSRLSNSYPMLFTHRFANIDQIYDLLHLHHNISKPPCGTNVFVSICIAMNPKNEVSGIIVIIDEVHDGNPFSEECDPVNLMYNGAQAATYIVKASDVTSYFNNISNCNCTSSNERFKGEIMHFDADNNRFISINSAEDLSCSVGYAQDDLPEEFDIYCVAVEITSGQQHNGSLNIKYKIIPVNKVITMSKEVNVVNGQSIILRCCSSASLVNFYDNLMGISDHAVERISHDENSCQVGINNIRYGNTGSYSCVARNDTTSESALETTFSVTVQGPVASCEVDNYDQEHRFVKWWMHLVQSKYRIPSQALAEMIYIAFKDFKDGEMYSVDVHRATRLMMEKYKPHSPVGGLWIEPIWDFYGDQVFDTACVSITDSQSQVKFWVFGYDMLVRSLELYSSEAPLLIGHRNTTNGMMYYFRSGINYEDVSYGFEPVFIFEQNSQVDIVNITEVAERVNLTIPPWLLNMESNAHKETMEYRVVTNQAGYMIAGTIALTIFFGLFVWFGSTVNWSFAGVAAFFQRLSSCCVQFWRPRNPSSVHAMYGATEDAVSIQLGSHPWEEDNVIQIIGRRRKNFGPNPIELKALRAEQAMERAVRINSESMSTITSQGASGVETTIQAEVYNIPEQLQNDLGLVDSSPCWVRRKRSTLCTPQLNSLQVLTKDALQVAKSGYVDWKTAVDKGDKSTVKSGITEMELLSKIAYAKMMYQKFKFVNDTGNIFNLFKSYLNYFMHQTRHMMVLKTEYHMSDVLAQEQRGTSDTKVTKWVTDLVAHDKKYLENIEQHLDQTLKSTLTELGDAVELTKGRKSLEAVAKFTKLISVQVTSLYLQYKDMSVNVTSGNRKDLVSAELNDLVATCVRVDASKLKDCQIFTAVPFEKDPWCEGRITYSISLEQLSALKDIAAMVYSNLNLHHVTTNKIILTNTTSANPLLLENEEPNTNYEMCIARDINAPHPMFGRYR